MSTTIAFANQKGGVSKTTTAYALGAACAARGWRVLLVDLDPQASLTISAGLRLTPRDPTINAAMLEYIQDGDTTLLAPAVRTLGPGLDLLPSIIDLASTAEGPLQSADRREFVLADLLQTLADAYDLVLIDCPPLPRHPGHQRAHGRSGGHHPVGPRVPGRARPAAPPRHDPSRAQEAPQPRPARARPHLHYGR